MSRVHYLTVTDSRLEFEDAARSSTEHQGVEFPGGEVGAGKIVPLTADRCHTVLLQPVAERDDIRIVFRTAPAVSIVAIKRSVQALAKSKDITA